MLKDKFIISPNFELFEKTDDNQTLFYVYNKDEDAVLTVNSSIFGFLTLFKTANTLNAVIDFYVNETQSPRKEVKEIILSFFKSMKERGILISENDYPYRLISAEIPSLEGQYWFNFFLIKRLSSNPPTEIYLAEQENGQKCIVKRLYLPENTAEGDVSKVQKYFQQEFKILKKLRGCDGICQLLENDKIENYAVIEYFEGVSLRKKIQEIHPPLNITEKCKIFTQILKTISFLHEKGILHGDLHYSNVLINTDLTVKIIDFDLALHIHQRPQKGILRGGVKEFLPPERIDINAFEVFNDPPDFVAEVFQIGVMGYFIFWEKLPFSGNTWKELAYNITNQEPDYEAVNTPDYIIDILKKSLHKNAAERFDSATAMYEEWNRENENFRN